MRPRRLARSRVHPPFLALGPVGESIYSVPLSPLQKGHGGPDTSAHVEGARVGPPPAPGGSEIACSMETRLPLWRSGDSNRCENQSLNSPAEGGWRGGLAAGALGSWAHCPVPTGGTSSRPSERGLTAKEGGLSPLDDLTSVGIFSSGGSVPSAPKR